MFVRRFVEVKPDDVAAFLKVKDDSRDGVPLKKPARPETQKLYFDLSLKMIEIQLTYDVLATVGFRALVRPAQRRARHRPAAGRQAAAVFGVVTVAGEAPLR